MSRPYASVPPRPVRRPPLFTLFEEDPAAISLRRPYSRLGMSVLSRAISDAAGVGIVASDHPWTKEIDGEEKMAPWLQEKLRGLSHHERAATIRMLMIDDARDFLLSPDREDDRLVWFRAAGVVYPGPVRMAEIIERRREMGRQQRTTTIRRGTSGEAASSRAGR